MAGGKWKNGKFIPDRDNKWGDNVKHGVIISSRIDGRPIGLEHGYINTIRVPSLKRSNYTWKNFYKNYIGLYERAKESGYWFYKGCKLKKIKKL